MIVIKEIVGVAVGIGVCAILAAVDYIKDKKGDVNDK